MSASPKNTSNTVILAATNDLSTDQRLHKVALSLQKSGFNPLLTGIRKNSSGKLTKRIYSTKRISIFCNKGPFFYAEYNIRLFFFLLFTKSSILISNDLDTLLATYSAYRVKKLLGNKKLKIVYDSHELFTELPELNGRKITRAIWLSIEKHILPKLKNAYTVCQSIADYYLIKYKLNMLIVRNMPTCHSTDSTISAPEINIPKDKKIILYQGALNIGRGIEQIIGLMEFINNSVFVIAGSGLIENSLKALVYEKNLEEKVYFTGKLPFEKMNQLTGIADLGLVLQEDISLSYQYVLPNRLFDFIKAGVPIIASDLPEISKIVEGEKIGLLVKKLDDNDLLDKVKLLLDDEDLIIRIKNNIKNCAPKYCWENEEQKLVQFYQNLK
jgi:glycosyltransferase involved in cell wall biosynthesis